jgi:hypothetical protein
VRAAPLTCGAVVPRRKLMQICMSYHHGVGGRRGDALRHARDVLRYLNTR